MRAPYLVCLLLLGAPSVVSGQGAEAWREHFAAGEEARRTGDVASYGAEMAAAAEAMPDGHVNRPFVQYHAARAAAMEGRAQDAIAWLRRVWSEDIEALMISFAPFDPAFADVAGTPGFREVMALAEGMRLAVRPLGGSVHLVRGAGSNLVAQVGPDGVLLVDAGYAPALPALRRALASLGADGVDLLVLTHPHEDHMGAAPGLGTEARVIAHPATGAAMAEPYVFMEGVELPLKPTAAYPDVEVSADTSFAFNGETVRFLPTEAHTAGDLSVYFEVSHVAHLGDTYLGGNPMMYPGTSDPDGFLDRLDGLLDSFHPETVVVGGHDGPVGLAEVRDQIAVTRACMALVRDALAEGASIEETAERGSGRFPPQWIGFFYRLFAEPES